MELRRQTCLLVDDEPPALEILRNYIISTPMLQIVGEFNNAISVFEYLQHHSVDIIFLDINLPKLKGTDFLRTLENRPKIIFTTGHPEFAIDGFEIGAIDYLLKPFSFDRFLVAVRRVTATDSLNVNVKKDLEQQHEKFIYLRADRKMTKVIIDHILFIESMKDYVRITLPTKQITTKQTITSLEAMLPEKEFVRTHRSFIVSIKHIDSFDNNSIFVADHELPIGGLYRHGFLLKVSKSYPKN